MTSPAPLAATAPAEAGLPLSAEQARSVDALAAGLDQAGLWWLSGYAAGLARARAPHAPAAPAVESVAPECLSIVYGSQTGNAKRVAERLAADAEQAGLAVRLLRADEYPVRELQQERHLLLVFSTQGEGEPSDDARELVGFLLGKRAPRLEQLHFGVLGLGDSSYPQFCAIGQLLDERLQALGASRLLQRGDADLDIETVAAPWRSQALAAARETLRPSATVTPLRPAQMPSAAAFDHSRPFPAPLLANQRITATGSTKDVRHIELSLQGSGLHYEPGDALGLHPRNPAALVEQVLTITGLDGGLAVVHDGKEQPLHSWLTGERELTRLARPFVAALARLSGDEDLEALLASDQRERFARLLTQAQPIDMLQRHPAAWSGEELVAALRPLAPRLYSIASSRKTVGDEAHLTVAHVAYTVGGQPRWGAASHLLASTDEDQTLPVYVEANTRFRLPVDPSRDIIMVGTGTGVAPFRAFVQEREATRPDGGAGRNWLFFGNPHFRSDFLYQLEWQRALKSGLLERIDLAFSRDRTVAAPQIDARALGSHRTYVQQRIREQGRALWDWLQNGAHLYVCGASSMGRDVHSALLEVARTRGALDEDGADEWLLGLHRQGRYARDVY